MSLTTPLIFILFSLFLLIFRRRRGAMILLVISSILFFLIGTGVLPEYALTALQGDRFVVQPVWKKQNAIVVLGAGTVRWPEQPEVVTLPFWANSRILEAARLYFNCVQTSSTCKILASGGDPNDNGLTEAATMARALKEIGIPEKDLLTETKSRSTFENARFTRELIQQNGFDQIYLVTSGFHMRRSQLYFAHFQIETLPAPGDHLRAIQSWVPVSFNFVYLDIVLHEYGGILQFHLYNILGWNKPV